MNDRFPDLVKVTTAAGSTFVAQPDAQARVAFGTLAVYQLVDDGRVTRPGDPLFTAGTWEAAETADYYAVAPGARPYEDAALFHVEAFAPVDAYAALELGRRDARAEGAGLKSDRYLAALAEAFVLGFRGEKDPYRHNRGANFAAGLRAAHRRGEKRRGQLDALAEALEGYRAKHLAGGL